MNFTDDRLFDDREAAVYLRLKGEFAYKTVQRWVRAGKLRAGRAGYLYRFRKQDLDDFVFSKS